ncbi:MAG: sensor histidine kinase [Flavobacteriales bacterium]|nr:sensor histidine kinase [Flavobacteriales bacterium]
MERFIDQKIKMIYRSIHDEKTGRQLEGTKVDMGKDVFQEINRDVEIWAEENKKKIKNLKDQMKFRREFIGNLSHELKTPLTIIQGNILTLLEGAVEDKSIREKFLIKASENVERLENLINDLDNITRLESGAEQIKLERFNVVALTEDVIENLERKAEDADISLAIKKKTPKEIWVNADRRKIDQVITNLLINSINYGKKGGKTSISFDDEGDNILVEIKDNGMGITNEALPRIFERFYRVDKSRARHAGGTGLGLAIVKHILEVHKQPISVTSKVGEGSAFSFTLNKAK